MEREFPKNVKQIGNVCDEPKIYVEDYVDTYLNQLKEKAEPAAVGAVLTGEILKMNGQDVVYIAGALKLEQVEITESRKRRGTSLRRRKKHSFRDRRLSDGV